MQNYIACKLILQAGLPTYKEKKYIIYKNLIILMLLYKGASKHGKNKETSRNTT
jgi:hypothetical protein